MKQFNNIKSYFQSVPFNFDISVTEKLLCTKLSPFNHASVLHSIWQYIYNKPFSQTCVNDLKRTLQRLLASVSQFMIKQKRRGISVQSMRDIKGMTGLQQDKQNLFMSEKNIETTKRDTQLEKIFEEEEDPDKSKQNSTLVTSDNETYIIEIVKVLRGLYIWEDDHFLNHQTDYFRLFEIAAGILDHYDHSPGILRFSP